MEEIKFNGEKLFKFRKEKGFSQEKLALKVGVSRQTIYLWESNQSLPDIEKVSKICRALEINVSDLVEGVNNVSEPENNNIVENANVDKKKSKKIIIRLLLIIAILFLIIYVILSTIKYFKLNVILRKWDKLDKIESYYIIVQELMVSKFDNNFESIIYEKYYKDGILKNVWINPENKEPESIIVKDYNIGKEYIIDMKRKTYIVEEMYDKKEVARLTYEFRKRMDFSNNSLVNYIYCFNPNFDIHHNESYELMLNNFTREDVNPENGYILYEETTDSKFNKIKRYYDYELNTDKDFEINLDEYTEVTQ